MTEARTWEICVKCSQVVEIEDEDACSCHFRDEVPERVIVTSVERIKSGLEGLIAGAMSTREAGEVVSVGAIEVFIEEIG